MTHALPVVYTRWFTREDVQGDQEAKEHLEGMLSVNVKKDLDAIEAQLKENYKGGKELYLVGTELSVADISEWPICHKPRTKLIVARSSQ
jgi:glutathione S-transferase